MKKTFVLLLFLALLISMCSCGNKINGVPESVVLRNVSIGENVTYNITHNYDSESHIDDVELITYYNGAYGTRTTTYTYAYEYDKSADLWTLIGESNGIQSDVLTLSEEQYMNNPDFSGSFNQGHSGTYEITIKDLDLTNKKATIDFYVVFDGSSSILSDVQTFDLHTTIDGAKLYFVIPYNTSIIVRWELIFMLDLDMGIIA